MTRLRRLSPSEANCTPQNALTKISNYLWPHAQRNPACSSILMGGVWPLMLTQVSTSCLPAILSYNANNLTNGSLHCVADSTIQCATLGHFGVERLPRQSNIAETDPSSPPSPRTPPSPLTDIEVSLGFLGASEIEKKLSVCKNFLSSPHLYIDDPSAKSFLYENTEIDRIPSNLLLSTSIGAPNKHNLDFLKIVKNYFDFNNKAMALNKDKNDKFLVEIKSFINVNESKMEEKATILENLKSFEDLVKVYGIVDRGKQNNTQDEINYLTFKELWDKKRNNSAPELVNSISVTPPVLENSMSVESPRSLNLMAVESPRSINSMSADSIPSPPDSRSSTPDEILRGGR